MQIYEKYCINNDLAQLHYSHFHYRAADLH